MVIRIGIALPATSVINGRYRRRGGDVANNSSNNNNNNNNSSNNNSNSNSNSDGTKTSSGQFVAALSFASACLSTWLFEQTSNQGQYFKELSN